MPQTVMQVRCPNCGNPLQAQVDQVVDVGVDPSAKSRLLSGSLNLARCSVCGYNGQLSLPLVYHDPDKQLLLTYMPIQAGLSKDEQERSLGVLIKRVVDALPAEKRKAYLLQPQSVLTMQGLADRILEADGISKEDLENQRQKIKLFEELMRLPEEQLEAFVSERDQEMDEAFFQLAGLALQVTPDERARQAGNRRLEAALANSSLGKRLEAQQQELRAAAESLQQAAESLTREKLLELIVEAPNDQRVVALVNLVRPGLDYAFFQLLSERIDSATGETKAGLENLRSRVLEITQQIDQVQQARAAEAAAVLEHLAKAEDLDEALSQVIPRIDDLFLATLQASLAEAEERQDQLSLDKLRQIEARIEQLVRDSLPPGLRLAQEVLQIEDQASAKARLEEAAGTIDDDFLNTLMSAVTRLEEAGDRGAAEHVRQLHRQALRISMRNKMQTPPAPSATG